MSRVTRSAFLGTLLAALASTACDKVPLLAPTSSTIRLVSSVGVLPLAGSADITAVVIEAAGTPVQNGTVVTFTASLGTFEPREARTQNGQATVRYVAGSTSGKAAISAFSGGTKSEDLEILVGAAGAGGVSVSASQTIVPSFGGTTTIIATVVDTGGNPLRNTPVAFAATAGSLSRSTAFSDDRGEARTDLQTNVDTTVSASVGAGTAAVKGEVKITARDLPVVSIAVVNSAAPNMTEVGIPTIFSLKQENVTTGSAIRNAVINFGDGGSSPLGPLTGTTSIAHEYARTGFYTVTVTATDAVGLVGVSSLALQVTDRYAIPVTVTAGAPVGGVVQFQATAQLRNNTSIRTVQWDFGDGSGGNVTTGLITTHRYTATGTYRVRVRVIANNGDEGFWEGDIRIAAV
jgi:PKD repeat protein